MVYRFSLDRCSIYKNSQVYQHKKTCRSASWSAWISRLHLCFSCWNL